MHLGGIPGPAHQWPGPTARATGARVWGAGLMGQLVLTAVSSTTNEVCSEESSVPVNFSVTVWPA